MAKNQDEFTKKRAQRQKKIRRRRLIIGLWFFIITALVIIVALSLTVLFPIKQVTASGSERYTSSQIVKATGINEKCNLFTLSESIVENNIRSVLPYVDHIEMERVFPDTIKITAVDAEAYACYYQKGVYYSVSQSGYVLDKHDEVPENTFFIKCSDVTCKLGKEVEFTSQETAEQVETLVNALKSNKIKIDGLDVTDIYDLKANVDGRFEVDFGSSTDIEHKVAHLAGMIEKIESDRSGKIDLSMWSSSKKEGSFRETTSDEAPETAN